MSVQLPTKYFQINNPRFIFKDKKCKGKDKNWKEALLIPDALAKWLYCTSVRMLTWCQVHQYKEFYKYWE